MKLPTDSIRWRLQIWYASLLLIALAGLSLAVLRLSTIHRIRQIDQQIEQQERQFFDKTFPKKPLHSANETEPSAGPPPEPLIQLMQMQQGDQTSSEILRRFSGTDPGYFYFALANPDGSLLLSSENLPEDFTFPTLPKGEEFDSQRFRGNYREHLRRGPAGIRVCFGKESSQALKEMDQFVVSIILFASGFWLISLAGGWWIVGRAIRPVQEISATAVEIAEGKLDKRIELAGNQSELNQLARVLNHTFDELEAAMERQRQFTGNASHELRTPLTVILSETQRMLKREREPGEYRESMVICQKAGQRMKALVEGLLLLARQENRDTPKADVACNLQEIVGQSLGTLSHLASEQQMLLETKLDSTPMTGDPAALRILVDNLVENAISHHPGGGTVRVTLRSLAQVIELEVADDGPGIPKEHHHRIFERFYQLDGARSTGHSGLGLALVSLIAANHNGSCSVDSTPGKGSRFTVRFLTS